MYLHQISLLLTRSFVNKFGIYISLTSGMIPVKLLSGIKITKIFIIYMIDKDTVRYITRVHTRNGEYNK